MEHVVFGTCGDLVCTYIQCNRSKRIEKTIIIMYLVLPRGQRLGRPIWISTSSIMGHTSMRVVRGIGMLPPGLVRCFHLISTPISAIALLSTSLCNSVTSSLSRFLRSAMSQITGLNSSLLTGPYCDS